jgi:hypothetical protein
MSARIEAAVRDYAAGVKWWAITSTYGINSETLGKALSAAGVPRRGRGNHRVPADRLREMTAAGMSDRQIAEALSCTRNGVLQARRRLNVPSAFLRGWGNKLRAPVTALALMLLAGQAQAHERYTALVNPNTGARCCGAEDCAVRDPCMTKDMREGLVIEGACIAVTDDMILPTPSWDGQEHGCFYNGALRCVIRGSGT